jgi:hypothetical protein
MSFDSVFPGITAQMMSYEQEVLRMTSDCQALVSADWTVMVIISNTSLFWITIA